MPAKRVCSEPQCPVLVADAGRCAEHRRAADLARGTRQQRGYDRTHDQTRARTLARANPATPCARCQHPLGPDYLHAHLDHTDDRTGYLGLSHGTPCATCGVSCNLSAGGRAAHRQTGQRGGG